VRDAFKPEFLNRLDDVLVFDSLTRGDLAGVVDIQLQRLARRLADRRIDLQVTDAAKLWLADKGYDPIYGARPLRRLVQTAVGDQLAKALLSGAVRDGEQVVVDVDLDGTALSVRSAAPVA
jgi:ATP-dependent Clp protease ATP-binding subunit ClpB